MSDISRFISECCESRTNYDDNVNAARTYEAYRIWCNRNKIDSVSRLDFIEKLMKHFSAGNKCEIRKKYHGEQYFIITLNDTYKNIVLSQTARFSLRFNK